MILKWIESPLSQVKEDEPVNTKVNTANIVGSIEPTFTYFISKIHIFVSAVQFENCKPNI